MEQASLDVAQAVIEIVAFFLPAFMAMIAIEWSLGFIRRD